MNNKREKILKYLSDLMTENEKFEFINDLAKDEELSSLLNSVNKDLNHLKELNNLKLNDNYYSKLITSFRKKNSKLKINFVKTGAIGFAFSLLILFSVSLFVPKEKMANKYNFAEFDEIIETYPEIASDYLLSGNYPDDYSFDIYQYEEFNENSEFNNYEIESLYQYSNFEIDYYELLNNLTEEEFNSLVKELESDKFLWGKKWN